jgi:hypothetical protein
MSSPRRRACPSPATIFRARPRTGLRTTVIPVRHSVISGPIRFDAGSRAFTFRSGTKVQYPASQLAPVIERFCLEVTRRTGLPLTSAVDRAESAHVLPHIHSRLALGQARPHMYPTCARLAGHRDRSRQ